MSEDREEMKKKIEEFRATSADHFFSSDKEIEDIILGKIDPRISDVNTQVDDSTKLRVFKDKLMEAIKKEGGSALDIDFLISDEGEPAIKFIGKTLAKQGQDYPILPVDYSLSFWEQMADADISYLYSGSKVGPSFYNYKPYNESKLVLAHVYTDKRGESGDKIEERLKEMGFRHATFPELMAYAKKMKNILVRNECVFALGTIHSSGNMVLGIKKDDQDKLLICEANYNNNFGNVKVLAVAE